jgi:hypothetical protein
MSSKITSQRLSEAQAYAAAWRRAGPPLEAERLRGLRQLSERQAAEKFALLLGLATSWPMRESSGLVEQQRLFMRLRDPHK